jgi:hypothetical protein
MSAAWGRRCLVVELFVGHRLELNAGFHGSARAHDHEAEQGEEGCSTCHRTPNAVTRAGPGVRCSVRAARSQQGSYDASSDAPFARGCNIVTLWRRRVSKNRTGVSRYGRPRIAAMLTQAATATLCQADRASPQIAKGKTSAWHEDRNATPGAGAGRHDERMISD